MIVPMDNDILELVSGGLIDDIDPVPMERRKPVPENKAIVESPDPVNGVILDDGIPF